MKIHVLGTGHADVINNYNTCFCIEHNGKFMLVDGGGGNRVLKQLELAKIDLSQIENVFISHNHTDHLLGIVWVLRIQLQNLLKGFACSKMTIYGSELCIKTIQDLCETTMGGFWTKNFDKIANFKAVKDNSCTEIMGLDFKFFDTLATDMPQMGFYIRNYNFVFAGDVPLNEKYHTRYKNANYLCLEAFCSEREKEGKELPLKKHYSVLKAAEVGEKLNIKNLIMWHTDDSLGKARKRIYTKEAKTIYHGNVIVPNDLETLEIT